MSDSENYTAYTMPARVFLAFLLSVPNLLPAWILIKTYIELKNEPQGMEFMEYLGYGITLFVGWLLLSAAILLDDFILQHRFFKKVKLTGERSGARHAVHVICRVVCVSYIALYALGWIGEIGGFRLFPNGILMIFPLFLGVLPALRLVDFVLWLIERRKGK